MAIDKMIDFLAILRHIIAKSLFTNGRELSRAILLIIFDGQGHRLLMELRKKLLAATTCWRSAPPRWALSATRAAARHSILGARAHGYMNFAAPFDAASVLRLYHSLDITKRLLAAFGHVPKSNAHERWTRLRE